MCAQKYRTGWSKKYPPNNWIKSLISNLKFSFSRILYIKSCFRLCYLDNINSSKDCKMFLKNLFIKFKTCRNNFENTKHILSIIFFLSIRNILWSFEDYCIITKHTKNLFWNRIKFQSTNIFTTWLMLSGADNSINVEYNC